MTPVDKDDFEDADLVRRLAALPQPEPSPELDAAIFAQVQKDLAPGPSAANDPATHAPRAGLLQRYRAPLAFAASLAGLAILLPVWRSMPQQETQPASEPILLQEVPALEPQAAGADAQTATAPSAAPTPARRHDSGIVAGQLAKPAPPVLSPSRPVSPPARLEAAAPPPPPPSPPAAPAVPAAAAAAPATPPVSPAPPPPAYAPPPTPAPMAEAPAHANKEDAREKPAALARTGIAAPDAKEWLQTIERLLDTGEADAATAQWKRFRKAHPDYPVPDTLAERLKAAE